MSLPETGTAILIAASSGRALATAARRAGYRPLVADFFDDLDTRGFCAANSLIVGGLESGFSKESLVPTLEALAKGEAPCGFVYGAGFEDRAELLEVLERRWTLFGNSPEVVRSVKDPVRLAGVCAALDIPHPEISKRRPRDYQRWLTKSAGGSGGTHVAQAGRSSLEGEKIYFQRIAAGEPVSILFLADGAKARVVGLSLQWAAPAPGEPFRFGGSLRPAGLAPGLETRLRRAAGVITAACGLRGLNSIDFLVEDSEFTLIEVNPRPGATLDIFEDRGGSLFRAHMESCLGRLPRRSLAFAGAAAAGIAYARWEIPSMPAIDWPRWASDRQKARSALRPYDPLCTIKARAATCQRARVLVDARTNLILGRLEHIQDKQRQPWERDRILSNSDLSINALAGQMVDRMIASAARLRVAVSKGEAGETIIDAGQNVRGGIEAGLAIAEICLGGMGTVETAPAGNPKWPFELCVRSADPVIACLASQYAGWALSHGEGKSAFFALGSGPGRALARKEPLFAELEYRDHATRATLVLESGRAPPREIAEKVAHDCGVRRENITFIFAPTQSLAGSVQVVARVLEVALHKAHELKFPLSRIVDGLASAPVSPPHPDFIQAMGRTNDAIIYGGQAHLFVTGPAAEAKALAEQLPSTTSRDYGRPFAEVFKAYKGDFYAIDPMLFSPARAIVTAVETGETFHAGGIDQALLDVSFG